MVQLSNSHTTTEKKNTALTIQTLLGKMMSLLFNTPSKLVIAFLPRSKRLLISWLQSLSTVILEPKKISLSLFLLSLGTFEILKVCNLKFWMKHKLESREISIISDMQMTPP